LERSCDANRTNFARAAGGVRRRTALAVGCAVVVVGMLAGVAYGQAPQPTDGMVVKRVEIIGLQAIS